MDETTIFAGDNAPRKPEWESLSAAVSRQVLTSDETTQQVLFTANASGHVFPDAAAAFWRTSESLLGEQSAHIPVLFFGAEVMNRFTRSREAVGFLLTDRAVVVRDSPSGVFGKSHPREVPLYRGPDGDAASAAAITSAATATFEWNWLGQVLDGDRRAAALQIFAGAVAEVLGRLSVSAGSAPLPSAPVVATDVPGRVAELGLRSSAKYADDPKERKHFAKLAKVVPISADERIAVTFTSGTLAGAYGVVLTDRAIWSRELMETAVVTPYGEAAADQVRLDKDNLIVAPGQVHTVPTHLTAAEREGLVILVKEILTGVVAL